MDWQTIKRPNARETEEDLLRFQEEFLKGKHASTTVIDKRKEGSDVRDGLHTDPEKLSNKLNNENNSGNKKRVKFDIDFHQKNERSTGDSFQVVERDTSHVKVTLPNAKSRPFPKVFQVKSQPSACSGNSSLFAQQMRLRKANAEKLKDERKIRMSIDDGTKPTLFSHSQNKNKSVIIDGSGLDKGPSKEAVVQEIHEENLKKLSEMPVEEILKAQQTIIQTLGSNIVAFLRAKKTKTELTLKTNEKAETEPTLKIDEKAKTSHDFSNKNENLSELDGPVITRDLETSGVSVVDEKELPIPPSIAKQWVHMDIVEKDKLAWMTDLPKPPDTNENINKTARFDFEGNLIVNNSGISVYHGLHHHGEEPEIPGYTIEELIRFSQSSMQSQKILGLGTLAKIIKKIHEGYYDEIMTRPILPDFTSGQVIAMFRIALDDNSPLCITSSVAVLHSLIVSIPDELSLDETFLWHRGEEQPFSQTEVKNEQKNRNTENTQQEKELSDVAVADLDVVTGLIRMDLLPRLRYIVDVLRPPAPVVIQILEILTTIARHSVTSATLIMETPRLLKVLFEEFCPKTWINAVENQLLDGKFTSVYGVPTHQAIKVFRTLASAGRHAAAELLSQFSIMDSLLCYLSCGYQEHQLPPKEAMLLCLESLRTWMVFLHYGLSTQSYVDFYPLIIQQLTCFQNICVSVDADKHSYDCDYAASLIKLLGTVLRLTSPVTSKETTAIEVVLEWETCCGLLDLIEFCLSKWLWEMTTSFNINRSSSRLIATSFNFVALFYKMWSKQPTCVKISMLERIEKFYKKSILPFMSSKSFLDLTNELRKFSAVTESFCNEKSRNPSNLSSLNSILWGGIVTPVLDARSPIAIMIDITRCLHTLIRLHPDLADEVRLLVLESRGVISYLNAIASHNTKNVAKCWLLRFETHLIYYLVAVADLKKCNNMSLYHAVSLKLLNLFQRGDEELLERLITISVFNPEFIRELNDATLALENLKITENDSIKSTLDIEDVSHMKLIIATNRCLPNIRQTYQSLLSKLLSSCYNWWRKSDSLFMSHFQVPVVTEDFFYYPLISIYRRQVSQKLPEKEIPILFKDGVKHCLQWCHLLECVKRGANHLPSSKLCYLSMAFLISSDLFLEPEFRRYLEGCFQMMRQKKEFINIDLNISVESGSFCDFFTQLLDQFEAMSYGDHLFGMLILVCMQRCHPIELRGAVWMERTVALSLINVQLKELMIPLKQYLYPTEDDENIIASYFTSLLNDRITWKRNPVLYLIAVHHLHHFLFEGELKNELLRESIITKMMGGQNKMLALHIQCYVEPDVNSEFGFICSEIPPVSVSSVIEKVLTKSR